MAELCVFPINYSSFLVSLLFFESNVMFIWVTARYLHHGKCYCKFENGWHNVIKKVKTLPVIKDKNVAAFFPISIKHLGKIEKET